MPTRRPLGTRPQSARMHRHMEVKQYNAILRDVASDQAASLEQAQQYRDSRCEATSNLLSWQSELKVMHVEAFKERQQQWLDQRAHKYHSKDKRRAQEWDAKVKAKYEDHIDARAAKKDERAFCNEVRKNQVRSNERYQAHVERERTAYNAERGKGQKEQGFEDIRAQCEHTRLEKAAQMDSFYAGEEQRKGQQYRADISKEMQRTQRRLMQMRSDKMAWQAACGNREVTRSEQLIEEKIYNEGARLADLGSELRTAIAVQQPKRQRPRTAGMIRPRCGGITAFSGDAPRKQLYNDATALGPRVIVVDPRASVGYGNGR